jgi:regulator of RNase E activity RraA
MKGGWRDIEALLGIECPVQARSNVRTKEPKAEKMNPKGTISQKS